jgi:ABC-type iron transport system FetAB ATPase subunit
VFSLLPRSAVFFSAQVAGHAYLSSSLSNASAGEVFKLTNKGKGVSYENGKKVGQQISSISAKQYLLITDILNDKMVIPVNETNQKLSKIPS